jgi:peptidoglycan pentaglycine glycine transferase (the first glycine)
MRVLYVTKKMRDSYDHFVKSMPHGNLRQGFAWGEVMSYRMQVKRLIVEYNGTIAASISIQKMKLPMTPWCFLYAPRGPIIDYQQRDLFKVLLEEIHAVAREQKAIFLRIDPDILNEDQYIRQSLCKYGFNYLRDKDWSSFSYPRILMRLDITPGEEAILKGMRKKHRQHINTITKKGVSIEEVRDDKSLMCFYVLMKNLSERKGFLIRNFQYYQKLMYSYGDEAKILLSRYSGEYLGGLIALIYGNKCWFLHGATRDDKSNLQPNEALHWEAIQWAKKKGCIFYDLGGTGTEYPPREDNPNYNLFHYKKGFGAEINYLTGYYDLIFKEGWYNLFRLLEEKGLPLGLNLVSFLKKRRPL